MGISRQGFCLSLSLLLAAGGAFAAPCSPDRIDLRAGDSKVSFSIEIADDDAERSQGLMFRETMPKSAGMLFVYETPRRAVFWMKNTFIPLDMIFANEEGRVTRVHANAIPEDETMIDGGKDVKFVLEINGGLAARLGITEGADLRHPSIDQTNAVWPCAE